MAGVFTDTTVDGWASTVTLVLFTQGDCADDFRIDWGIHRTHLRRDKGASFLHCARSFRLHKVEVRVKV